MNIEERNRLVVENLPLVGYLVSDLCARATHLSREDMASAGALALVLAADAYDAGLGVPFGAFARRRILGAFTDELRSLDWAGRGTRRRIKDTLAVAETLTGALGRNPKKEEIAATLGVSREVVDAALADAARTVSPLDDSTADALAADTIAPEDATLAVERNRYLKAAVNALPEKMRHVIIQIYIEGNTVKDVAAGLGLTSAAVSQQRAEAIRLLRDSFAVHYPDNPDVVPLTESRVPAARRNAYLAKVTELAAGVSRSVSTPLAATAVS